MQKSKLTALLIALTVTLVLYVRDGSDRALAGVVVMAIPLIGILFSETIAYFSGFGFPEVFARDYGSSNHPGPYAFFFWILFVLAGLFLIFDWKLY